MTDSSALRATMDEEAASFYRGLSGLIAYGFFLVGLGLTIWSFFMGVASPADSSVANLDLLFGRLMVCLAGVGLMITGAIFIAARRRP